MTAPKTISRRHVLRDGSAMLAATGIAMGAQNGVAVATTDGKIQRLAECCLVAFAAFVWLRRDASAKYKEAIRGLPDAWGLNKKLSDKFNRRGAKNGYFEAWKRCSVLENELDKITNRLADQQAKTLTELRTKARVIRAMEEAFPGEHGAYDNIVAFEPLRDSLTDDLLAWREAAT